MGCDRAAAPRTGRREALGYDRAVVPWTDAL